MQTTDRRTQRADGVILVCFAMKEEAAACKRLLADVSNAEILITGIGQRNASRAIRSVLETCRPGLVLTCGFAGGLNAQLTSGTVVFDANGNFDLEKAWLKAGARAVRFYCAERVVATAAEKRALLKSTRADAVEMESQGICAVCAERKIPCATLRVILDAATEDLPLDFNRLMTPEQKMNYGRLATAILRSPGKIAGLLKLRKRSQSAAEALAQVLLKTDCLQKQGARDCRLHSEP
jgi:nucleoside phosphorylase